MINSQRKSAGSGGRNTGSIKQKTMNRMALVIDGFKKNQELTLCFLLETHIHFKGKQAQSEWMGKDILSKWKTKESRCSYT